MAIDSPEQVVPALRNPDVLYKRSCGRDDMVFNQGRWRECVNNRAVVKDMVASGEEEGGLTGMGKYAIQWAIQFHLADFALLQRPIQRHSITGIQGGITEQSEQVAPVTAVDAFSGSDFQPALARPPEFWRIRILVHGNAFHARGRQIEGTGLDSVHNENRSRATYT